MMWSAPGYRGFDIDAYMKNSSAEAWAAIPADQRDTRATPESAANAYLDALLAWKADVMPWGFPCSRTAADGSRQGRTGGHCATSRTGISWLTRRWERWRYCVLPSALIRRAAVFARRMRTCFAWRTARCVSSTR